MGISISGSNAISGLSGNDTDFDKVLEQLKSIEKTQLNRLEAWKSDWNLRYESFTQIIEQIQAASSMLSQLSDKNNFVTKLVQSSNENVITAVANASAQDVQHTITVSQVASNAIWANTGHIFDSKTDVINTSGEEQYFKYRYAGKDYEFKVPANTTLESFASMINNSADNPGIKVSIISTGNGYVFQVAGKSTGVDNDLLIYDSNLVGMNATSSTSTWTSNSWLNASDSLTNPTSYTYDIVMRDGSKKSVTVKGNATGEDLAIALNNAASLNAVFDKDTGTLTMNALSFSRRETDADPYTPASTRVILNGSFGNNGDVKLNEKNGIADGLDSSDTLEFTVTMEDDTTREFKISASATKKELLVALARITQSGTEVDLAMDDKGWGVNLSGVKGVSFVASSGAAVNGDALTTEYTAAKGDKGALGSKITSAVTTITFDAGQLEKTINGSDEADSADDLVFTLIGKDGKAYYIDGISSGVTNQELVDHIKSKLGDAEFAAAGISFTETTDADGNVSLAIDGIQSFKATTGSVSGKGFSTDLKVTTEIPATSADGDLFYKDGSNYLLEKAPDLVYTVTTNEGFTGTLTLPSGTSMSEVLSNMKDVSKWTWTGGTPASLDFSFVDADGNPVDPATATVPFKMSVDNVQSISGPAVTGQITKSSNWNIQNSANAIYQVDNWPIELQSASNTISDTIDGMVINLQDVGTAKLSVSTDVTSVEQSIQNFLDAVNSVIVTVNGLMAYDEDKEVTSNDPNDIGNSNYSPSGLTSQKGGLLMGNYGVQLFKSRFNSVVTSSPPGFTSRQSADDVLSGDLLAALANLGIKTDTDSTSDTYGLLVIAPSSSIAQLQTIDSENYSNMISNNLEAVVDFFCSSGTGSTSSTDFRYGSHLEGITKAGAYDVKYTVTADGQITNVTVGGEPAKRDESQPGNYFSVATGDPRGLAILIDDLTPGEHPPAGEAPMQVRIKQGLVQTVNSFLKDELTYTDVSISAGSSEEQIADTIALKAKNGALMSLRDNYKKVMESIDVKIEREQRRISTWEARQKAIFARLETLLSSYSEKQSTLEAQLKQLSSD